MVTITDEFLRSGQSTLAGWTRAQLKLVGVHEWPLVSGWKNRIIGNRISDEDAQKFLDIAVRRRNPERTRSFWFQIEDKP